MVLPEGRDTARRGQSPSRQRRILAILAAIGVVAGVLAMANLTAPAEPAPTSLAALPTTTAADFEAPPPRIDPTLWSVSDIETEDRLVFKEASPGMSGWPVGFFEAQDRFLLFLSTHTPWASRRNTEVRLWVSEDAMSWTDAGLIDFGGARIHQIKRAGRGIIAVGRSSGSVFLARSEDGREWATLNPPPLDGPPIATINQVETSDDGETIVVLSQPNGPWELIGEFIAEDLEADGVRWDVSQRGDDLTITLQSPLGLAIDQLAPEELGIDSSTLEALFDEDNQPRPVASIYRDGNWEEIEIGAGDLTGLVTTPQGRVGVLSFGGPYPTLWTETAEGSWQGTVVDADLAGLAQPWHSGIVSVSDETGVMLSDEDLSEWSPMGSSGSLPQDFVWHHYPAAASDHGIAVIVSGYGDPGPPYEPESVQLRRGDVVFEFDPTVGRLSIQAAEGGELLAIPAWTTASHEQVIADIDQRTVTFVDPESGEPLVTLSFAELAGIEDRAFAGYTDRGLDHRGLLHSETGDDWSITDVGSLIDGFWPAELLVSEKGVILVAVESAATYGLDSRPPDLALWVGATS